MRRAREREWRRPGRVGGRSGRVQLAADDCAPRLRAAESIGRSVKDLRARVILQNGAQARSQPGRRARRFSSIRAPKSTERPARRGGRPREMKSAAANSNRQHNQIEYYSRSCPCKAAGLARALECENNGPAGSPPPIGCALSNVALYRGRLHIARSRSQQWPV